MADQNAARPGEPSKQREFAIAVAKIHRAMADLDEAINETAHRFAPVIRPLVTAEDTLEEGEHVPSSDFEVFTRCTVNTLFLLTKKLHNLNQNSAV